MIDYIIIGVIIALVAIGFRSTVKHFKGEGGCCGGGDHKPKKKRLKGSKYKKVFRVDGMHCEHCKNRVEEIVNSIDGIAGKVDLKKGELTVSYARDIDDDVIKAKIEAVGYTVLGCRTA